MVCAPTVNDAIAHVATPVAGATITAEQPLISVPSSVKVTDPARAVLPEGIAVTAAVNVTC
jgi:hypothetical protein